MSFIRGWLYWRIFVDKVDVLVRVSHFRLAEIKESSTRGLLFMVITVDKAALVEILAI